MITPSAHLNGLQSFARVGGASGVVHAHRSIRRAGGVVSEPAIAIVSPGIYVSVAAQGQRMPSSGTDLYICEIIRQVRIRRAVRLLHYDRRSPVGSRPVAELAIVV